MRSGLCYFLLIAVTYSYHFHPVLSWNTDEMEVFDAVEEVKENFYTLLNVPNSAFTNEIKKSFRKLSLTVHPDHNPSPTADEEFRHLVLAFDILKSSEKRKYYDNFLVNGLPDWKNAMFYYRRVRKMGLQEMFLILAGIISIGQYLFAWASYLEQKFTLKELLKSKDKKYMRQRKKEKTDTLYSDEYIEAVISKPSIRQTLPFQIVYLIRELAIWVVIFSIVSIKNLFLRRSKAKEPVRPRETQPKMYVEKPKRMNFVPELVKKPPPVIENSNPKCETVNESPPPVISGGLWTDDDILDLIKLVKKYPAGESQRWVKIASAMGRSIAEVTHMSNRIKINDFKMPNASEESETFKEEPKKIKTKGGKLTAMVNESYSETELQSAWTQVQQKAFEAALNKYSKKTVNDRWGKISSCVPGKTKEECILRYKKVNEMINKLKEAEENKNKTEPVQEKVQEKEEKFSSKEELCELKNEN